MRVPAGNLPAVGSTKREVCVRAKCDLSTGRSTPCIPFLAQVERGRKGPNWTDPGNPPATLGNIFFRPVTTTFSVDRVGGVWLANAAFPGGKDRIATRKSWNHRVSPSCSQTFSSCSEVWIIVIKPPPVSLPSAACGRPEPRNSITHTRLAVASQQGFHSEEGTFPAEPHRSSSYSRFSRSHGHRRRSQGHQRASRQGPSSSRRDHADQVSALSLVWRS
mgnify:FL=1